MLFRLLCGLTLTILSLWLSGCTPAPEGRLDEQKNPHYLAGKEKASAFDYKGAIESFERAVEDNPRAALAHYELGVLYDQHENDYAAALYHYNKALKLRPNSYPADNIRQRIPACKQELVKADSLATINPAMLRETERLREENQLLRKQIETLQAQVAYRVNSAIPTNQPSALTQSARTVSRLSPGSPAESLRADTAGEGRGGSSLIDRSRSASAAGSGMKAHSVKMGETPASVARLYRIRLDALLEANPGLDPKRMRVGQVLNVPSS